MIHKNLGLVRRSAMKSRKHGGETMIRKAYWGVLTSIVLALAFGTGCSSNTATAPPSQVVTITAMTPFAQNAPVNNPDVAQVAYASPFNVIVTSNGAPGTGTPGTPVAGVVVTFSAPGAGAGGTFNSVGGSSTASATTNSSGLATSPPFYADGTVGTYNVIASSAITTSTATFFLSNTLVPAPAGTTVAGGSPQSTSAGTQFATALSVTVLDSTGAAVSGLPVTFTVNPVSGAGGTFADTGAATTTATTNSSGVATAAAFTANSTDGVYTVTAETPGNASSTTFTLSNTTTPASITPVAGSTPQNTPQGTVFTNPLAVVVLDANGVAVANAVVTFTAPSYTYVTPPTVPPTPTAPSGDFYDSTVMPPASPYDLLTVNVWTDATGTATAPAFEANTLPSPAGTSYNVKATVVVGGSTAALSATFALTND